MKKWWEELGYPSFTCGKDGFPHTGEVIKYYREKKKDARGKRMSQSKTAQEIGITDRALKYIESRDSDIPMSRRLALCSLLGIPGILLNVHTPGEIKQLVKAQSVPARSSGALDLADHRQVQQSAYNYHKHSSALWLIDALLLKMDSLYRELPHSTQKQEIMTLLGGYHRLIAAILRDDMQYSAAISHLSKALLFADELDNDEDRVSTLIILGRTLEASGLLKEALEAFERAALYEKKVPNNLNGVRFLYAAPVIAQVGDSKSALVSIETAGSLVRQTSPHPRFDFTVQRYHLTRGKVLGALGEPKEALEELSLVRCVDGSWWQAYQYLYEAEVYLTWKKYPLAVSHARAALVIVQKFASSHHITRITTIYDQVKASPFGKDKEVKELGELLAQ